METNKTVTVQVETVGQAYLEVLRARGIKYFFGNSGTDFGPVIDALARFGAEKKIHPMPITVPHEFVAVSMAQGYAMITGEPQVVMVHVIVGTGNASAAVMNASRLNVPMIFSAGRTPLTEEGFVRESEQLHPLGAGVLRSGRLAARVYPVGLRAAQWRSSRNRSRSRAGNGARHAAGSGLFDPAARSAGAKDGLDHDPSEPQGPSRSRCSRARHRSSAPRRSCAVRSTR